MARVPRRSIGIPLSSFNACKDRAIHLDMDTTSYILGIIEAALAKGTADTLAIAGAQPHNKARPVKRLPWVNVRKTDAHSFEPGEWHYIDTDEDLWVLYHVGNSRLNKKRTADHGWWLQKAGFEDDTNTYVGFTFKEARDEAERIIRKAVPDAV